MKRRRFSAEFKRKVVLEAMRGDEAIRVIAARHNVNPNQVSKWKAEAHEGLLQVFRQGKSAGESDTARLIEQLYARIGELTVERDFFLRGSRGLDGLRK